MKKILLIGVKGQLGHEITRKWEEKTTGTDLLMKEDSALIGLSSNELDITDKNSVLSCIKDMAPDVIINSAAYTNVDEAEDNFDRAFSVNAIGARNLAIAAETVGAKLAFVSTDYVFDGKGVLAGGKIVPYREYDATNPVNVYGKTKLLGEQYTREFCSRYFIIRTSWLYGENGSNFVKTIIKLAKEKGFLQVVNDQTGNPTNTEDLAEHILRLVSTDEYGIYHCTGNGACSWYDFACRIVQYAGIRCTVEPVTSEQFVRKAKRPAYSCLDNMMLRNTIGDGMREWEEALEDFIKNRLKL